MLDVKNFCFNLLKCNKKIFSKKKIIFACQKFLSNGENFFAIVTLFALRLAQYSKERNVF